MTLTAAVLHERIDTHIALVTINRPDARNAVNPDVATQMDAIVTALEADPDIRVVILQGAGEAAFCAGADLKAVAAGQGDGLWTQNGGFAGFVFMPRRKVWIAAVDAAAVAGGCELALACDLIVASNRAFFALPEVKRGLIAVAGGVYRLPRRLPPSIALEMIATGEPLSAERAYQLGLVNRLTDAGEARAVAIDLAQVIAANAPLAVERSMAIARQAQDLPEEALRKLSSEARAFIMTTADFREGPRAFVEKRAPQWQGR